MGYGYIEMRGGFEEEGGNIVNEKSLFIPNIKKDDIIKLGVKYEQYSVLYKDNNEFVELGTNDDSGIGQIKNDFIKQGWNKNLNMDSNLIKSIFSELVKGSHRGEKFLFNMKESHLFEVVELSFNERAYHKKIDGVNNKLIKLI